MQDLLFLIYLVAVAETGKWTRTINTLVCHGMTPRQIVDFIAQVQLGGNHGVR